MPSPTDSTWPTSATSASLPKLAICCFRIAEISAARISISVPLANAFHRQLQAMQPPLQRRVGPARAALPDHAAQQAGVDLEGDRDPPTDGPAQLLAQCVLLRLAKRLRRRDLGGHLAAPFGELVEIALDHRRCREEPPIGRHDREKVACQLRQPRPLGERGNRLRLVLARHNGAAQQSPEIDAFVQHRAQFAQIAGDRVELVPLVGQIEQCRRITSGQAACARCFRSQRKAILDQRAGEGRSRLTLFTVDLGATMHRGRTGPAKPARFVTQMLHPRNGPGRRRDARNSHGLGHGHQLAPQRNIPQNARLRTRWLAQRQKGKEMPSTAGEQAISFPRGLTRYQWTVFLVVWAGWALDATDFGLYSLVLRPALTELLGGNPSIGDIGRVGGILSMAGLLGWAFGGFIFGILADYIGRVRTLALSILIYSVFTACQGFSDSAFQLGVFRFLGGLGTGGELIVGIPLVAEAFADTYRARVLGVMMTGGAFGSLIGGWIYGLIGVYGWRYVFFAGIAPAVLLFFIRRGMVEPEHFQAVKARRQGAKTNAAASAEDREFLRFVPVQLFTPRNRYSTMVGLMFCLGTLLAIWTTVIWLPTIQTQMLERDGITGPAAIPFVSRGMMLWGIGGIFGYAPSRF